MLSLKMWWRTSPIKILRHISFITLIVSALTGSFQPEMLAAGQVVLSPDSLNSRRKAYLKIASANTSLEQKLFLPVIFRPNLLLDDLPIWAHDNQPAPHEVTLFRHRFALDKELDQASLHIFADTRYEVWIDGVWIGRGPARFSTSLREYDVYHLDTMTNGDHLIAVLVQWAPNLRRSESVTPHLQGHIQGTSDNRQRIVARTGEQWKSYLSSAWRSDASPVHSWGLIGPTEIVDLRQLPPNWHQPAYPDTNWPAAKIVDLPEANYLRRSIPFLVNVPITPTVADAGLISPGQRIGEIIPPTMDPYQLDFSTTKPTTFTISTLFTSTSQASTIQLDGADLPWQQLTDLHPDIYSSSVVVDQGQHTLSFANVISQGRTFSVSSLNNEFPSFPFEQGSHAGHRLLLADLENDPSSVDVSYTPGMNLDFTTQPSYVVLDLGRTIHGRLQAQISGRAGTVVDIGWDERLSESLGKPLPYPGSLHPQWNQVDSWILDGTSRSQFTIDVRSGRYILIAVWGTDPVQMSDIRVYEERYPLEISGSFQSSNMLLDQIWGIGVDTLYPNMTDAYSDTPWRERGQWWGDAYVEQHVNGVVSGDTLLTRRGLHYMADAFSATSAPGIAPNHHGTHMLDYAMLWVHSLSEYVQQTGDIHFLSTVYPTLKKFIDHLTIFENLETGLIDLPIDHWSRTAYVESLGVHSRYGQSTAINAYYFSTLHKAADLAEQIGDINAVSTWRQKAEDVKQAVNDQLYDPTEHRYYTNLYQGELFPPTPHAQAWALAYDLPPESERDQVVAALLELLSPDPTSPNLDVYGMFWVLEALGKTGRISDAIAIIENYYGYMIDSGATTWWESMDAVKFEDASLSHGWGGSPTWFLTTYVLGIKRVGSSSWAVTPSFAGVTHASGSLPLEQSLVHVRWERLSCRERTVEITSDENSNGEITIQDTNTSTIITLNGDVIWRDNQAFTDGVTNYSGEIHIFISGGNRSLRIHQEC
jgi:alpha-L-rhamnosidase